MPRNAIILRFKPEVYYEVKVLKLNRNWLFFPMIAIGILILVIAVKSRPDIPVKPALSKARNVDVISLETKPFAPVVTGFGRVRPKRTWQGIAEVGGKVIYRNPLLEKGQVLPKDTLLLKIDPKDYQIAKARAQADLNASEAKLAKLALNKKSINTTLNIEKRRLKLRENELARQKNLKKRGLASQSALDSEQQAYYAQQTIVQELESNLKLLPSEQKMTEAELEAAKLALVQAERNLARTEVVLPFVSRVAEVNIEEEQVVTANQVMVEVHGLGEVEVEAQVSIHDMQILFSSLDSDIKANFSEKLKDLTAEITLSSGSYTKTWQALVTRLSDTVDMNQATVGVILDIALDTEKNQELTSTPTLVNGMFVKAQIIGRKSLYRVVPERALRGDSLYLSQDNRLKILPVNVLFRHDEQVAIQGDFSSFSDSPLLVLNDLIPALEGMLLKIVTKNTKPFSDEAVK